MSVTNYFCSLIQWLNCGWLIVVVSACVGEAIIECLPGFHVLHPSSTVFPHSSGLKDAHVRLSAVGHMAVSVSEFASGPCCPLYLERRAPTKCQDALLDSVHGMRRLRSLLLG